MSIPFKCEYLVVSPTTPASVPDNTLFVDSTALNVFSIKDDASVVSPIATSSSNPFIKTMQADGIFSVNIPLVKLPNGRVILADSNSALAGSFCGYSITASSGAGVDVSVLCCGTNIVDAVLGLGFAPGDMIYINENGGYTNDPSTFTGDDDTIVRVGLADCASGAVASPVATDLIAFHEFVASP